MRVVLHIDSKRLPEHTPEQLVEWLRFECGVSGSMQCSNPLCDRSLEAEDLEVSP